MNTAVSPAINNFKAPVLKLDRLSICYNETNSDTVKKTCGLLADDHYQSVVPGMLVTKNPRYLISCQIPVPFAADKPDAVVTFEAGPRRPGMASYRLDMNPARLSLQGFADFLGFLEARIDADTTEFFQFGKLTRCDFAVDFHGLHLSDVVARSPGLQKHGVYSDRYGDPETVYIGTPRSRRIVCYEKRPQHGGESHLRLECRVKPLIPGYKIWDINNPFAKADLLPADFSMAAGLSVHPQFIADAVRIGGLKRAVRVLSLSEGNALKSAFKSAAGLIPDLDQCWLQLPEALQINGLAKQFGLPGGTGPASMAA